MASLFLLTPGVLASSSRMASLAALALGVLRRSPRVTWESFPRPSGVMPSTKRPQGTSDGFCTAGVLVAGPEGIWADPEAFGEPVKAAAAGGGT